MSIPAGPLLPATPPEDTQVQLARIANEGLATREKYNTIRLGLVLGAILVGIALIGFVYLQAIKPDWLSALSLILAALFGSSGVAYPIVRKMVKANRQLRKRNQEIEELVRAQQQRIADLENALVQTPQQLQSGTVSETLPLLLPSEKQSEQQIIQQQTSGD